MPTENKIIQLPKNKRDPQELEKLCLCRPVCKNRRRERKGIVQNTSAELLIERKPKAECFRRWPTQVYPNGPCPLLGRARRPAVHARDARQPRGVVRLCTAPVDDRVDTPYLRYAEMAKRLGAWDQVMSRCPFCACRGACCACAGAGYAPRDADRTARRRDDMRAFDSRVKADSADMKIMYDI